MSASPRTLYQSDTETCASLDDSSRTRPVYDRFSFLDDLERVASPLYVPSDGMSSRLLREECSLADHVTSTH